MEIGSFYEIDPETAIEDSSPADPLLPEIKRYEKKNTVYTSSGREAIALALYSLEKEDPKIRKCCLMPAYMCDTVFIPFLQQGWELKFYHVDKRLEADRNELGQQIDAQRPSLLFIHDYYGVDTWKPMRSFLHSCQKKGIRIMEDLTQSYYLEDSDCEADYIIGSLRKWFAMPDGGFLTTNHPVFRDCIIRDLFFAKERLSYMTDKWKYLQKAEMERDPVMKEKYLCKNREMEEWLDQISHISHMSEISKQKLKNMPGENYLQRRKENTQILQDGLYSQTVCRPVVAFYPDYAAPLYYAVYVRERETFQNYLIDHKIYAPVLWPVGEVNRKALSTGERYIFDHLLALPMDQRYGRAEMEYIVKTIKKYETVV